MKKLFILLVLGVFAAYCHGAYHAYGTIPTARYADMTLDIMGMSPAAWVKDPTAARDRLNALARSQYYPPLAGYAEPALAELGLDPDTPLTVADYQAILEHAPGHARNLPVRDPAALLAVVDQRLRLREPIQVGETEYPAGTPVTMAVADALSHVERERIPVVGQGSPIGFELGTMMMTILIFLALVMALRLVLFDPILKIMDEREKEIADGVALAKRNREETERLAAERKAAFSAMRREHLANLSRTQQEAMKEADVILKEAKTEAHRIRDNAHHEFRQWRHAAEPEVMKEVDAFADMMVNAVLDDKNGGSA